MYDKEIENEITKTLYDKKSLDYKTKLAKRTFIGEINGGLGKTIKENPYQVTFYRKPWYIRFGNAFKKIIIKIFTRF
jgi:hypothetical protein